MMIPKILIVDDEPEILEIYAYVLQEAGFETDCATGGIEAFQKYQNSQYDLMITDYRMPIGDGLSLIKNIRLQNETLPIFCVTGFADQTNEEIRKVGASEVFAKPINHDHLVQKVQEALKSNSGNV